MGADARLRLSCQIHRDDARIGDVIRIAKQLLDKLSAALSDGQRPQRPVARVAVRPEDHLSAARVHLAHVLVNYREMRRYENAAVFFRRGQAEYVIILVDRSADRTQRIVTVRHHIGKREFFESGRSRRLNDPDERDVVARHRVEALLQMIHVIRRIVRLQDRPCDGPLFRLRLVQPAPVRRLPKGSLFLRNNLCAVQKKNTAVIKFYHLIEILLKKLGL